MNDLTGSKKIGFYIVLVMLSLAFLMAGGMKVSGQEMMVQSFLHFGLPVWFMYFIGAVEVVGVIALWIHRLSALSAIGLAIIMAGAFVMHTIYDPIGQGIPAVVLAVLLGVVIKVRLPELRMQSLKAV